MQAAVGGKSNRIKRINIFFNLIFKLFLLLIFVVLLEVKFLYDTLYILAAFLLDLSTKNKAQVHLENVLHAIFVKSDSSSFF